MAARCRWATCPNPATTRLRYESGYVSQAAFCDAHAAEIGVAEYARPVEKVPVGTRRPKKATWDASLGEMRWTA